MRIKSSHNLRIVIYISSILLTISIILISLNSSVFALGGSHLKPNGMSIDFAHDAVPMVINSRSCPGDPTKAPQHDPIPELTKDEKICWACTPKEISFCHEYCTDAKKCTIGSCINSDIHRGRDCIPLGCKTGQAIVGDALFDKGNPGVPGKYWACGGPECTPMQPFILTKDESKVYLYDNKSPICIRGGFASFASYGSGWIEDDEIRRRIKENIGTLDTTLTYKEPTEKTDLERIYTGSWTNKDVQSKGICSDAESGCNPYPAIPFYSGPQGLTHRQEFFLYSTGFIDLAKNTTPSGGALCPSSTSKIKGVRRTCTFIIDPKKIKDVIVKDSPDWFKSLSDDDKIFLSGITMPHAPYTEATIQQYALRLRVLSNSGTNSLSAYRGIPPKHDLLYTLLDGSCMYTPRFESGAILPLVDRIKSTIEVSAEIGSGVFTPVDSLILKQEGTLTGGVALTSITGSYLAGSGTISITLVDSGSSTFTPQLVWDRYNGVSGIKAYTMNICRTKTHTGMVLNSDCLDPVAPHTIYSTGMILTAPYSFTGEKDNQPHIITTSIDLADTTTDGIQVTGEYQIYIAVLDAAGNTNTSSAIFTIIPSGFDPSLTRLDKYNVASIETPGTTLYTITGSNVAIYGGATEVNAYANAIDIQTYKISIFDKYANPIYNWNLYDFGLTQTGIYLDEVNKIGPSALFVYASGGILSNSGQTGTTNGNGSLKFNILSYTPGTFFEQFEFKYKNWDRYGNEIGPIQPDIFPINTFRSQRGTFNHIFTGSVNLYTTKRIDLGTSNDVRMDFFTTSIKDNVTLTGFTVSRFLETIKSSNPLDFTVTATGTYSSGFTFATYYPVPSYLTGATGSFIPEQKGTLFGSGLKVETYPYITLTFSGYTAQYYVSDEEDAFGSGITYGKGRLNRIYIDGMTSAVGKTGYVNSKDIVGVSTADTRNAVHKNVALLLRNRDVNAGGGIINRVKYLTGDVTSQSLTDMNLWDVLIIKGGNFIIGDNYSPTDTDFDSRNYYFNSGTTSLESVAHKGIIVLKDDVTGSGGNIYIKPDVRFIGASLFADESIESTRYDGTTFTISNSARTFLLNKQLIIFGSVLSKNTVGGAVRADSNGRYTLPWKNASSDLNDAVRYDLSFLRMDNYGFISGSYLNRGHEEFVVILIDPRNVSNPLPGFLIR